jgi:glutamate synthase domain-containing protein 1
VTHRATPSPIPRKRPQAPVGLYDPAFEHDACGIGAVAKLDGIPSHETVVRAIRALENLEHRGATGADAKTGDGAGITIQLPDEFFRAIVPDLPAAGAYGVAVCFLPRDDGRRAELERIVTDAVETEGQRVVTWRDVPLDLSGVGVTAAAAAPVVRQLVVAAAPGLDADAFERKLYVIRRVAELAAGPDLVFPSFSSRTIVYKGMLTSPQVPAFYPDLNDERVKSSVALVHSRFSTNTFPSWELAHPYRLICHNG